MSTLRIVVEFQWFIESTGSRLGEWVSHYRRLAAAGVSLAVAGIFISAPAQAAASRPAVSKAALSSSISKPAAGAAYKSFSSTAKTPGHTTVGTRSVLPRTAQAAASTTIYVLADPVHCTKEIGLGTNAQPYCLLQSAVNAAVPGDTIYVYQNNDEDLEYNESVSIANKSNLTIVSEGGIGVGDAPAVNSYGLRIQNSTGITVRGLVIDTDSATTADVYDSSNITFDQDSLLNEAGQLDTLDITGGSSGVSITRSTLADNGTGADVDITSGAQNITLASDVLDSKLGIAVDATGVKGADIVGDTIERGCDSAVEISSTSSAVSIENNVFEAGQTVAACSADVQSYSSDVTVDATSATGTTSDYNDFIFNADDTSPYSWNGTAYATLAAFQDAVTTQGAHDAVDPTRDAEMFLSPAGEDASGTPLTVDAVPVSNSLSTGTANTAAPGYLSTDFYSRGSYTDRGALEYVAPSLTAALIIYQTSAHGIQALADGSVEEDAYALYTFNWGDGTSSSGPSTAAVAAHTYATPGTYDVLVTVTDGFNDTSSATVAAPTAGSDYTPITPVRVLDTRNGIGTGGTTTPVGAGKTLTLKVAGVGQIPTNATAVALNFTATDETVGGHLTVYPAGNTVPATSTLDYGKNQNIANTAIVTVGQNGEIELDNASTGTADFIADASGYFTATKTDGYQSLGPVRLLDTRTSTGGHDAPLTATDPVKLKVAGVGGVPADAKAVVLNLTVATPTAAGYIKAYPDGGAVPVVSNVNFVADQTIPNAAIVPVGADGDIDIALTGAGSARMVVDVNGYFSGNTGEAASALVTYAPNRYLDSRTIPNGTMVPDSWYALPLGTDFWGNLMPSITGILTNTTVTGTTAQGNLTVFPEVLGAQGYPIPPSTSSLNFPAKATVQNMVIGAPGTDGNLDFLNESAGNIQLIVDTFGYFQND